MRLTVESGSGEQPTIDVDAEIVIGRDEDCDLVLHDEKVSRRHAAVTPLPDGRALIVDLGSSNGTFVDGVRADSPVELDGNERIRIGESVLSVRAPGRTVLAPKGLMLRIESGDSRDRRVEASGSDFVIGREPGSDLVLSDPTVSARHASISVLDAERGILTDLGSRNGTFVNGRQIYDPVLLSGGERVRLGDTVVSVIEGQESPAATAVAEIGAWLTIESGPQEGTIVKVTGSNFIVGRDERADLILKDSSVSRRHARLRVIGPGRATITDLESRNGILVGGVRIPDSVELRGGERVRIGDVELRFGEGPSQEGPGGVAGETIDDPRRERAGGLSTATIARASASRPWLAIGVWVIAFLVGGGLAGAQLKSSLTTQPGVGGNPDSKRADALIRERLHTPRQLTELIVVRSRALRASDPSFRSTVERLRRQIVGLGPGIVTGAQDYYRNRDPALLSDDQHGVLIPVALAGSFDTAVTHVPEVRAIVGRAGETPQFETYSTGEAGVAYDFQEVADRDLRNGESIGLAVAFLVLLAVFGTVVAALVPVLMAIFAIGIALGLATLVAQVLNLSIFVTNMTVGMGFALGIDYSLFVLTRFREERARGRDVSTAIETAAATSGGAVLFSGMAVILALVGMALVPDPGLRSLGIGAILVAATSVLAALTLLPAWLSLLGDRIERFRLSFLRRDGDSGWEQRFWHSAAQFVMRRPVLSLLAVVTVLVAAAIPVFDLNTGTNGVSTLPDSTPSKQGFDVVRRDFVSARSDPVRIVVAGQVGSEPVRAGISRLQADLRRDSAFGQPQVQRGPDGTIAIVSVPVAGDPKGVVATDAVKRLRSRLIPSAFAGVSADVLVTGTTARDVDYVQGNRSAFPFVLVFVLGLSFILLMIAFRSIVVPAKAVVMNLLSVGAAYGLLVLVFQKGVATNIFGFRQVDRVEAWVPIFLFAVLFGLSMDYHVFLLSRIRERFNETGDNRAAVAYGITSTARIITGAALIMVAVFSGFALGELVPFQQLGFGMGVALLVDATLIRSVLVPAGMRLLGARNWYLPKWLRWLPEINVEGPASPPPVPADASLATEAAAA
jgi:putative drug exporter of the RND superfamily